MVKFSEPTERELLLRVMAMPADTNPLGNIFGGWLMAQMDIAAGSLAHLRAQTHVVTVAIDKITFIAPVFVSDIVSCYGEITREGTTSLDVALEVWTLRDRKIDNPVKVTEATFTFVAVDDDGTPVPLPDLSS